MTHTLYAGINPEHLRQEIELKATQPLHDGLAVLGKEYADSAENLIMKFANPVIMYKNIRTALKEARKVKGHGINTEKEIRDAAIDFYRDYLDDTHTSKLSRLTVKPMKDYLFVSYVGGKGPVGFVLGPMRVLGHRVNPGEIYGTVKDGIKKCGKGFYQKLNR